MNLMVWAIIYFHKSLQFCLYLHKGGIADSPGNIPDVFHTFFGLAALSLHGKIPGKSIHPAYSITYDLLKSKNEAVLFDDRD
jgi:geranylgeranyl transferase type-2 subunit beta